MKRVYDLLGAATSVVGQILDITPAPGYARRETRATLQPMSSMSSIEIVAAIRVTFREGLPLRSYVG